MPRFKVQYKKTLTLGGIFSTTLANRVFEYEAEAENGDDFDDKFLEFRESVKSGFPPIGNDFKVVAVYVKYGSSWERDRALEESIKVWQNEDDDDDD